MEAMGIMLYGYTQEDAENIKKFVGELIGDDLILFSATEKEQVKIIDILKQGPASLFGDEKNKILMFLGFNNEQIGKVMRNFQSCLNIERPIFCGLTEQNVGWTFQDLLEHLLEEERHWAEKNRNEN